MKNPVIYAIFILLLFSCSQGKQKNQYLEKGKKVAEVTFKTLSGQVKGAIEKGGVSNAVQYCNLVANPLVDSISKVYSVDIRRVTFNARNPENRPKAQEKEILIRFEQEDKEGNAPWPTLDTLDDGRIAFFAPIYINNPLCLVCHGNPGSTISEEDYAVISKLYPEDEAIGYQLNDLRGMWSITFNE